MKTKKIIIFIFTILAISCFNKKNKDEMKNNKNIQSGIFNLANKKNEEIKKDEENKNDKIINLSDKEKEFLLKNNIDPMKVSQELNRANEGKLNSILMLAQLYYRLGDKLKTKEILQIGVNKNYVEAMYNLAIIYEKEGDKEKAEELHKKISIILSKNEKNTNKIVVNNQFYEEYNKGIDLLREKKYEEALEYFEKAYDKGVKDSDIQIAYLYDELKNEEKAVEWLKKAVKRGNKNAIHNLGAILFSSGKTIEARPYLLKSYKAGKKKLAMAIAISYTDEKNMKEALKWYEIASNNGDTEAEKIVKDIKTTEAKKLEKTFEFFIDNTSEYNFIDRTILEYLYPPKPVKPQKAIIYSNKKTGSKNIESKAEKKSDYNITREEIFLIDKYKMNYK